MRDNERVVQNMLLRLDEAGTAKEHLAAEALATNVLAWNTLSSLVCDAVIRQCGRCGVRFVNGQEGCNAIVCDCGARMCYVCAEDITAQRYRHFCDCSSVSCTGCHLYEDTARIDFERKRRAVEGYLGKDDLPARAGAAG